MDKAEFVHKYLQPLLRQIGYNIKFATYFRYDNKEEFVKINYENGYTKLINVTADSLKAIVYDVLRGI